ncbi:MAG: DUF2075 domain-containing protein [Gammaproteobacteria bacterium]|nr:DUF2075 domain-containing protein [Gammaproteobacteria bacterium]
MAKSYTPSPTVRTTGATCRDRSLVAAAGYQSDHAAVDVRRGARLHLSNAIRAYRNPLHAQWVAAPLRSDMVRARSLTAEMRPACAPEDWLRQRRRGARSVGLLASSGAVRPVGDGVPPAPRSNELGPIGHRFLKPFMDFRSSGALETPMSEFGCQGLELGYTGLCYSGNLIWSDDGWIPCAMRTPEWQVIRDKKEAALHIQRIPRFADTCARASLSTCR